MVADVIDGASPNQRPFSNFNGSSAGQFFNSSDCRHFRKHFTETKLSNWTAALNVSKNS